MRKQLAVFTPLSKTSSCKAIQICRSQLRACSERVLQTREVKDEAANRAKHHLCREAPVSCFFSELEVRKIIDARMLRSPQASRDHAREPFLLK
jgi:hypothetical protein